MYKKKRTESFFVYPFWSSKVIISPKNSFRGPRRLSVLPRVHQTHGPVCLRTYVHRFVESSRTVILYNLFFFFVKLRFTCFEVYGNYSLKRSSSRRLFWVHEVRVEVFGDYCSRGDTLDSDPRGTEDRPVSDARQFPNGAKS